MATFVDNTGIESTVTVAELEWDKTAHSSYTNFRSVDGRFFIGQTPRNFWRLWDGGKQRREVFAKAKDAQIFAALMVTAEDGQLLDAAS